MHRRVLSDAVAERNGHGHRSSPDEQRIERVERDERHERQRHAATSSERLGNGQRRHGQRRIRIERSERRQVLVEPIAGEAWRFRTLVEREASVRFLRLAKELEAHGFARPLIDLAAKAAEDEKRHAALCLELATALGASVPSDGWNAASLAPRELQGREALLYEIAAQCCVAETESMATLTTLMEAMAPSRYREAVVAIGKDEVDHARLGWAVLEAVRAPLAFLEPYLGAMLDTGGAPLFEEASPEHDSAALVAYGVLPHAEKRRVFEEALEAVIVPGFQRLGIATDAIDAWLRRATRAARRESARSNDPRARE